MDPDRHCRDEAAPTGSSLYYATLFTGARERDAVIAVHALRRTLVGIVDSVADPHVRARKLNWWSDEIMEARDGRARHPVAIAVTRHYGTPLWRRPEVLAMLAALGGVSSANGFTSAAERDRFCDDVGGGTARLCATAGAFEPGENTVDAIRVLGAALEGAMLASFPIVQSGLKRIPDPAPGTGGQRIARDESTSAAPRVVEERTRARGTLVDALDGAPGRAGTAMLVHRTLAHIQIAALGNALRKPDRTMPPAASITPIRKLWIAWRTARRDR